MANEVHLSTVKRVAQAAYATDGWTFLVWTGFEVSYLILVKMFLSWISRNIGSCGPDLNLTYSFANTRLRWISHKSIPLLTTTRKLAHISTGT